METTPRNHVSNFQDIGRCSVKRDKESSVLLSANNASSVHDATYIGRNNFREAITALDPQLRKKARRIAIVEPVEYPKLIHRVLMYKGHIQAWITRRLVS